MGGLTLTLTGATQTPEAQPASRVIYIATVEYQGGGPDLYPSAPPPGPGYQLGIQDATGNWTIKTFRWSPGTIVLRQGETVTLDVAGVAGTAHEGVIPGVLPAFTVTRGQVTQVTLSVATPGIYSLICTRHAPMQATVVVLPK